MLVDFVLLSLSGADLGIHNPACVLDRVKSSGRSPADSLTLSSPPRRDSPKLDDRTESHPVANKREMYGKGMGNLSAYSAR